MRLNGWMRIGIVLSIAWMVGATGYYWVQEQNRVGRYFVALSQERSACIGKNAERRSRNEPEVQCTSQQEVDDALSSGDPFYFKLLVPTFWLIVSWLGIGITYVAGKWILRGFRQT
jgi:hypothetical protein